MASIFDIMYRDVEKYFKLFPKEQQEWIKSGITFEEECVKKIFPEWLDFYKQICEIIPEEKRALKHIWIPKDAPVDFLSDIKNAKKRIYIVSGAFSPSNGVFGDNRIIESILHKLNEEPATNISITVGNKVYTSDNKNPFIEQLCDKFNELPGNLELSVFNEGIPPVHCRIIDGKKMTYDFYRYEFEPCRTEEKINLQKYPEIKQIMFNCYNNKTTKIKNKQELISFYNSSKKELEVR